jgi:hypothetical protein
VARNASAAGSTPWPDAARPCLGRTWLAASEATEAEERHFGMATGLHDTAAAALARKKRNRRTGEHHVDHAATGAAPAWVGTQLADAPEQRANRAQHASSSAQRRGRDGEMTAPGSSSNAAVVGREAQGPAVSLGAAKVRGSDERSVCGYTYLYKFSFI